MIRRPSITYEVDLQRGIFLPTTVPIFPKPGHWTHQYNREITRRKSTMSLVLHATLPKQERISPSSRERNVYEISSRKMVLVLKFC